MMCDVISYEIYIVIVAYVVSKHLIIIIIIIIIGFMDFIFRSIRLVLYMTLEFLKSPFFSFFYLYM